MAWDIGAHEYTSGVTNIAKEPPDGSVAITGKASVRLVNDMRQPLPVNPGVALTAVAGARLVNHIRTPLVG